jgi:hypothetical protein
MGWRGAWGCRKAIVYIYAGKFREQAAGPQ